MPDIAGFYMVFEKKEIEIKYNKFLKALMPYGYPSYSRSFCEALGEEKARALYESLNEKFPQQRQAPRRVESSDSFYVLMFHEDMREMHVNFSIRVKYCKNEVGIWFFTHTPGGLTTNPENGKILRRLFFGLSSKLDPLYAADIYVNEMAASSPKTALLETDYEYYRDPYFFCLEPVFSNSNFTHDFLRDSHLLGQIREIKKVLPKETLVNILKKYSLRVVLGKEGAGVEKPEMSLGIKATEIGLNELGDDWIVFAKPIIYPRYFVRKAVRAKGILLPEGITEKCAKIVGIK